MESRPMSMASNAHRAFALDALRGIAALTVVLNHIALLAPLGFMNQGLLSTLTRGHQAVILFFVLSGFALATQIASTRYSYASYTVRRICRIYIPYIVAIAVAAVGVCVLPVRALPWAGPIDWVWKSPLTASIVGAHLLLLMPFDVSSLNPVVWSLIYEMRISLIFPFFFMLMSRRGILFGLGVAAVLALGTCIELTRMHVVLENASTAGDWLPTLNYTASFLVGAALALKRTQITEFVQQRGAAIPLLVVGTLAYASSRKLTLIHHLPYNEFLYDWFTTIAGACIIAGLLAESPVRRFFESAIPQFFGHISYSVYLYHLIILVALLHIWPEPRQLPTVLTLLCVLLVPVSYLSYRFVELPSIDLGRRLAAGMSPVMVRTQSVEAAQ